MKQCQGKTTSGRRCRHRAKTGGRFCGHHDGFDLARTAATLVGAAVGNALAPGLGGVFFGGAFTNLIDRAVTSEPEKKKVYCAFDFEHDRRRKGLFIGQSKNRKSPFEVYDHSLLEAAPEREWKRHAQAAIKECDLLVVLLGPETHRAPGVLAEVAIARRLGVRSIQLRRQGDYWSQPVHRGGRVVDWTWDNLARELA